MPKHLVRFGVAIVAAAAPFALLTPTAHAMPASCELTTFSGGTEQFEDGHEIYHGVEYGASPGWEVYRCYDGVWVFDRYESA